MHKVKILLAIKAAIINFEFYRNHFYKYCSEKTCRKDGFKGSLN